MNNIAEIPRINTHKNEQHFNLSIVLLCKTSSLLDTESLSRLTFSNALLINWSTVFIFFNVKL